jgi:alkyl hydroperoxide reductase subunit AhpC
MSESVKLGQKVPEFELSTYDSSTGKFGNFQMDSQIDRKRWTILFFYPADFTFV